MGIVDGVDRTIFADVSRDAGVVEDASDWFAECNLAELIASTPIGFIGLFLDTSGSMRLATVRASYDKFIAEVEASGQLISRVCNPRENWIDPFLTQLTSDDAVLNTCD